MTNKKYGLYGFLLIIATFLGGCNLVPEPVTLIQAPNQAKNTSLVKDNVNQVVSQFLPQGSTLFTPNAPVGMDSIIETDFDQDGVNEIVLFYKSNVKADKTGAIILQKHQDKWGQIGNITGTGYDISWGSSTDITGDGKPELLVGFKMGVSSGSILDVYRFEGRQFEKLTQLNYHDLDLIYANNTYQIATWQRSFADVYQIQLWKWDQNSFVQDKELYESYFSSIAKYYQDRIKEVPDASYYYYYLADALLKANQPQHADTVLSQGMSLNVTVPSFNEYLGLQKKIKSVQQKDVVFYEPTGNISVNIPMELVQHITIESEQGENFEYVINVHVTDSQQKARLFTIGIYSKDFIQKEELSSPLLTETNEHFYTVLRNKENPYHKASNQKMYEHFNQAIAFMDEMIAGIEIGAPFTKHKDIEEELLIEKILEATNKKAYVNAGGTMESEMIESFTVGDKDYRYVGTDLDSFEKLFDYMSASFTQEAIQSYIESAGIIEHEGKIAQPNADGGSLLNYSKASIVQVKDLDSEKQIDLKVPIGNTFAFETVSISFMKTENGWRISSNPITF